MAFWTDAKFAGVQSYSAMNTTDDCVFFWLIVGQRARRGHLLVDGNRCFSPKDSLAKLPDCPMPCNLSPSENLVAAGNFPNLGTEQASHSVGVG